MDLDKRMKAKRAMTPGPGQGFNVVGVDTYEEPGEELFLIANCKTREEAEAKLHAWVKAHPEEPAHIYGSDTQGGDGGEEKKPKLVVKKSAGRLRAEYEALAKSKFLYSSPNERAIRLEWK